MIPLSLEEIDELLRVPYSYEQRPRPVPADTRPVWRVPYVLLLVRACRGNAASLQQLHVLNWAVRSHDNVEHLLTFLAGDQAPERPVVRYEPALDRAIALARGMKLLDFTKKLWRINDAGAALLAEVDLDSELLQLERGRLAVLPRPLTQTLVAQLLKREPR